MKIRNGFVSNSSSSSFVVAFPKKPEYCGDVRKIMFNDERYKFNLEYFDNLTTTQISELVYRDLERSSFKKATLKDIAELFTCLYHYYENADSMIFEGKQVDKHGGCWYNSGEKYYGTDEKLLEKLRLAIVESAEISKSLALKERKLKNQPKKVRYAYEGGIKYPENVPYTVEEIKAYEQYNKDMEKYHKTDKEYLKFRVYRDKTLHDSWKKIDKCRYDLAKADAKVFLADNKGKFIFVTSYCDNNGPIGGFMEHADIFKNVPHVQISMH